MGPGRGANAIYVLIDQRSGCVAYVGKTNSVDRRFWQHADDAHSAGLRRWQDSLRAAGVSPVMTVVDSAGDDWPLVERAWIAYYKGQGRLLNIELGGPRQARCKLAQQAPATPAVKPEPTQRVIRRQLLRGLG